MVDSDPRRAVPRTDRLLDDARLQEAQRRLGRSIVRAAVARAQQEVRDGRIDPADVIDAAVADLPASATSLRPVINATGVLLHTNLGRAPLSQAAIDALIAVAGCTDVEFDLATGERARRGRGALAALRNAVPDAGDAFVVNNGAAALLLAITTLAAGKEVIISRGEMVEIGDGFRLPDLAVSTSAQLREVGTTNRTTVEDYRKAVTAETGCILKVHPSNFSTTGFVAAASTRELASLGVPVVVDIGSGLLQPEPLLPTEPDATTALRDGATIVTASGDKLLGGPQCGLVLGDANVVAVMRRHPIARALRVDKLTLAALEATLCGPQTPTYDALHADVDELRRRAEDLARTLKDAGIDALAVESQAAVGGGGAPGVDLPSAAVSIDPSLHESLLRHGIVGRVEHGRCLLDLRSVPSGYDEKLREAIVAAAG